MSMGTSHKTMPVSLFLISVMATMSKLEIASHVNSPYPFKMVNVSILIVHQLQTTYASNVVQIIE